LQTIGFESDGDTWTKSKDAVLAFAKASSIDTMPCFSPRLSISITSLALIFLLIGVDRFFKLAMRNTFLEEC
jgi:hypothetical protein